MRGLRTALAALLAVLLAACASSPAFDTAGIDRALTPRAVTSATDTAIGRDVLWGGVILNTTNLKNSTLVEVLAYPLDSNEWPLREEDPLGRFVILKDGYLEPATYAEGRLVSVTGTITGTRVGQVGAAGYTYPVVSAKQLHLWPRDSARDRTRVIFGVGVGVGL
jgi:outer membrane lipoprotein